MNIGSDDMDAPMTTGCMNIGGGRDIPYRKVDGCMNYRKSFSSNYPVLSCPILLTLHARRISRGMHELQIQRRLHELRVQ